MRDRIKQLAPKSEKSDDEEIASEYSGPSLCDTSDTEPEVESCASRASSEDDEERVDEMTSE